MPVKIHHPKNNSKHKQKLLIVQGKCDDSAKVIGVLTHKTTGTPVDGQKMPTKHAKSWGYRYQGLTKGDYNFKIDQTNSPVVTSTDAITFSVAPPVGPPPANTPPTVTAPASGDTVARVFFPMGTSNPAQPIIQCLFAGNGQNIDALPTVQGPDGNGDWNATVNASNCPSGAGYTLTVANLGGPIVVANLSLP